MLFSTSCPPDDPVDGKTRAQDPKVLARGILSEGEEIDWPKIRNGTRPQRKQADPNRAQDPSGKELFPV
jgi:hypothetical protein